MKKLFALQLGLALATSTVNAETEWTPIGISDFFETATDSWIAPPDGDSGAPRQGWMSTPDGFFTKEWHVAVPTRKLIKVQIHITVHSNYRRLLHKDSGWG